MNLKTLEQLIQTKVKMRNGTEIIPDFRISVQGKKNDGTHIIVHPYGYNGDTLDFIVKENKLTPFRGAI